MAQELGEIREIRADLRDLHRLVETLTGMIEGLPASRQDGNPEQAVTAEEDNYQWRMPLTLALAAIKMC